MKGARKDAHDMITEAGSMIVYVAGYPAIMGLQPLYFKDPELARRARMAAESTEEKKRRRNSGSLSVTFTLARSLVPDDQIECYGGSPGMRDPGLLGAEKRMQESEMFLHATAL